MKRFLVVMAVLLGMSSIAQAELRGYDIPASGKTFIDSLTFRSQGTPTSKDSIIGAALKDTTTELIKLAGLESWSIMWKYSDAPGPTTSGTWAVRCTLQVSVDSTNWFSVSPGAGVWAHTASSDTTIYQVLFNRSTADSAVGLVNGPGIKRQIDAALYGRFILTVANSADDTVYISAIQARRYGKQ